MPDWAAVIDFPDDDMPGSDHGADLPDAGADPQGAGVPSDQGEASETPAGESSGALAPQAEIVSIDAAKQRRMRLQDVLSGTPPAPPPTPNRDARAEGKGGSEEKPPAVPKKEEKKIDWGRYAEMLERFVLVYPTDTAWDHYKRKTVKISNMAHMFGSDYVRMWKASKDRKSIDEEQLVFDPTMTCPPEAINIYDGLALEPVPCADKECEVMIELLRHLCGRCDSAVSTVDEVMHWALRWLALPFQKPGAKLTTALVFHGPQGVGKNLFFDVIRDMYGKYGVMVGQTEIEEKYNGWLSGKQLVIGNEVVSRQELYHNKNRLKWVISEPRIPIRTMNTDTRWESNHANLIFLSNEKQPLVLEIGDRRYLVVYTPVPEDRDLYARVRAFLEAGGAAKFLDYLMRYPLEEFHEHSKPPMTEAKQDLIELSMKPEERFMQEWISGYLHLPMQVCSAEQLYRAFRRWCDNSGERFPPPQAGFTTAAKRWAIERIEFDEAGKKLDPCVTYKISTLPASAISGRKSIRCFLPRGTGPMNGVNEGQWIAECVDAFESSLRHFLHTREGGGNEAEPTPAKSTSKPGGDS